MTYFHSRQQIVARRGHRSGPGGGLAAVERELAEERASALGRAGRRLEEALDRWRAVSAEVSQDATPEGRAHVEAALLDVRDAAYALLVQRDCAGFRMDNLGWIRRYYDIPDAALRRI